MLGATCNPIAGEGKYGMLDRIFLDHPRAMSQSYRQHQRTALSFSGSLLAAGLAAAIHGVVPCLFKTTASRTVHRLHRRMTTGQPSAKSPGLCPGPAQGDALRIHS